MSIPRTSPSAPENALKAAHMLVDMGVPVFRGSLTPSGDPDRNDARWRGWNNTRPSHASVDKWKPGEALCAVTGTVFDVLDVDPRNGGLLSIKRLSKELGDDGPEIYWKVKTPSGGWHYYVRALGIGKHTGFMRGLDLQGGRDDGTSRGFVFLPPTIRPSKVSGERTPYVAQGLPQEPPEEDDGCEALRSYVEDSLGTKGVSDGPTSGRKSSALLRVECIAAQQGEQRSALLRYVHELERMGREPAEIMADLINLSSEMPCYDKRNPWYPASGRRPGDYWLKSLMHKKGQVIPDAAPGELDGFSGPVRAGYVQWVSDIEESSLSWLWYGRCAFGEITLVDGEKGKGKSFMTYDLIARATRGLPMPGMDQAECGPITVMLFTDEGGWDTTIRPRLRAAGADLKLIARVSPVQVRKNWGLPSGAKRIGYAIREAGAQLAVFDPITDMIGEEVNSHNDASVRRALAPLARELSDAGCAGFAIRHFNKAVGVGARNRGSGSAAFQNRARVHMVTGELRPGLENKFGVAIVDTNLTSKSGIDGVVGYNIVDSEIPTGDRQGTFHGKIEWGGVVTGVSADELADGPERRPGPAAVRKNEVIELLADMFEEKDTWPAQEVISTLSEAGASTNKDVLRAAREALGIRTVSVREKGQRGVAGWNWTTAKVSANDGAG